MSHAIHFLERLDRVPRSLSDFALSLYRDEERVRWIVHYAHLPESEERIALALADGGEGPYIVVTREGRFVTALGAGMRPGNLSVLSRGQVDAFSARVEDQRRRMELATEMAPPGKGAYDVLALVKGRASGLGRGELEACAAWAPFLKHEILEDLVAARIPRLELREEYLKTTDKASGRPRPSLEILRKMWSCSHALGAQLLLLFMGDIAWVESYATDWASKCGPTWYATDERILSVAIRGAWAAARTGKHFLPVYKRLLFARSYHTVELDAVLALIAIGIRHAHLADDVRRIVGGFLKVAAGDAWTEDLVTMSHRVLDDPEAVLREMAALGAKRVVGYAKRLRRTSPFRFTREEDVPRELALCALANQTSDSVHPVTIGLLPWAAKVRNPEELYLPDELARVVPEPSRAEIEEVYGRHRVHGLVAAARQATVRREVERVERVERVGRNEGCACGSGRKYKKCCGR